MRRSRWPWNRAQWPWWVVGVFVVPLCINLTIGIPYEILVDRDIQLNGTRVEARVTAARDVKLKSGWAQEFEHRYDANGAQRVVWLGGPEHTAIGSTVELVYSPQFPWRARLPVPGADWNENLASRLAISYTLAIVFATIWFTGLRNARRKNG